MIPSFYLARWHNPGSAGGLSTGQRAILFGLSDLDDNSQPGPTKVRMAWRLVLYLFTHLVLLLFLAVYLIYSLNSVRLYTPLAHAEELQIESLNIIPSLLAAMDAERRVLEKSNDPRNQALYEQMREAATNNLDALKPPIVLPSELETRRRTLVRTWLSDFGDFPVKHPKTPANMTQMNAASDALLGQINEVTEKVRAEEQAKLTNLQTQEANDATGRVNLMWVLVGSVSFLTILIQLHLANSIIGPIQTLSGVVRRIQKGDYTARAHLNSRDEIQSLGETFKRDGREHRADAEGAAGEK